MFILFDNLIKGQIKKAIYNLLWQISLGFVIYFLFIKINITQLTISELVGVSFFIIPPLVLSVYILFKENSNNEITAPFVTDKNGNREYIVPANLFKSGLSSLWVNVVQGESVSIMANVTSLLISCIISPVYLLAILYLYLNDYSDLTSSLLRPFGIISIGIFAIQSRILLANYINADYMSHATNWAKRLKLKKERELFIIIDLGFIILATVVYLLGFIEALKYVLFLYGLRLIRIVLLIPYFETIWVSIIRGIRLSSNYIFSFLIVLFVLSISSRVLFSEKNSHFKSLLSSIYTNFQIVLGN